MVAMNTANLLTEQDGSANIKMQTAVSKIVAGATSLSLRNNADSSDNVIVLDNGNTTVRGTLTATGGLTSTAALTPTGGINAQAGTLSTCFHSGGVGVAAVGTGTDKTATNTETYIVEVNIPYNVTLTGISILHLGTSTGNVQFSLADSTGAVITAAQTASTAAVAAAAYQQVPFAVAYAAKGPAKYFILMQNSGSNHFRAHNIGNFGASKKTSETYGTFTAVTPPTTFTADLGPICDVY